MKNPQEIRLIGVASGLGAQDPGCGKGPWALKHTPLGHQVEERAEWLDLLYPHDVPDRWAAIGELAGRLARAVADTLAAREFPVVIGGDHSCAVGTWSGAANALGDGERLGLIWIDAHMDSHRPETSLSHAIHGMPLAVLLGQGKRELLALVDHGPVLRPENLCLIAVRSYEEAEAEFLDRLGVRVITIAEVRERGIAAALAEARAIAGRGTRAFGISLDLDAIDPSEAPGIGSPEPAGLAAAPLLGALHPLLADPALIALEIAEFNPEKDRAQRTRHLVLAVLEHLVTAREGLDSAQLAHHVLGSRLVGQ